MITGDSGGGRERVSGGAAVGESKLKGAAHSLRSLRVVSPFGLRSNVVSAVQRGQPVSVQTGTPGIRLCLSLSRARHPGELIAYRLRGRRLNDSNRVRRHPELLVVSGHRAWLNYLLPHLPLPPTMSGTGPKRHHSTASSRLTTRNFLPGSKPTLIYQRTKNLRAVQLLLGHTKLESTIRYLGVEVQDALEISEQTDV